MTCENFHLKHHRGLRYAAASSLPPVAKASLSRADGTRLVSFRPMPSVRSNAIAGVTACSRFHKLPGNASILCVGVETDSPLAPLILWDLAHGLAVGATIELAGDGDVRSYLEEDYFKDALVVESRAADSLRLRKLAVLPAERNAGLDAWTFGIPVGPGDASLLNVVVERILSIDLPHKEILLCGRPGTEFKYWEHVRIVGEDIPAPPVQICTKKNRLVKEARHPNLCLLHDRVMLPAHFAQAVQAFGDFYPFTTFQSLYFDDRLNAVPRRYSDYNLVPQDDSYRIGATMKSGEGFATPFARPAFASIERRGFSYAHAHRYSPRRYATGSLYLVKRDVWLACPQDERLAWSEFEDVEQGLRGSRMGIPSRVNPFGLTQSLVGRPLLSIAGEVATEAIDGKNGAYRPWLELWPLPRKPLFRMTESEALQGLRRFVAKYSASQPGVRVGADAATDGRGRLRALLQASASVHLPLRHDLVRTFLVDYERWVVHDQLPYSWLDHAAGELMVHGEQARTHLLVGNWSLRNQLAQRPYGRMYARTGEDYLVPRGWLTRLGTLWAAVNLWASRRRSVHVEGGLAGFIRCIWNSTPFLEAGKGVRQ